MATHSSIPAWKSPWTEKPGGPWSTGLQRVGHDRATEQHVDKRFQNMFRGGGWQSACISLGRTWAAWLPLLLTFPMSRTTSELAILAPSGSMLPVHCFVRCSEEFPIPLSIEKTCALSVSVGVDPLVYRSGKQGTVIVSTCGKVAMGQFASLPKKPTSSPSPGGRQKAFFFLRLFHYYLFIWPCNMRDLSSLTRDQTHTPCKGSMES